MSPTTIPEGYLWDTLSLLPSLILGISLVDARTAPLYKTLNS